MNIISPIRQNFHIIIIFLLLWNCIPQVQKKPVSKTPFVRVLLEKISSKDSLHFTNAYYLYSEEARYEFGKRNQKLYIVPLIDGLQLFNKNRNLIYKNHFPIIIKPAKPNSHFMLKKRSSLVILFLHWQKTLPYI